MHASLRLGIVSLGILTAQPVTAVTRLVGPGQTYATPCAAIAAAGANDTIQVDASGSYSGDVCAWTTNGLTLVGVNGRPHIDAGGSSAQGKAIWVIAGNDTVVDNFEFSGCQVIDMNGAGIRQEGANLTVRHSWFHDNQDGILAGDHAGSTILIEYSQFSHNGAGDGFSHNLYVNHVDKLVFRYNWSHDAVVGHLLKTRALQNYILYNRLTGEAGSSDSYELTIPSGGTSFVVGNLIEQPATTQNGAILDYLSESGTANPDDHLYIVNNTFVNDRSNGTFLQIGAATVSAAIAVNNIFFGVGTITTQAAATLSHNYSGVSPGFVDASNYDFHLQAGSPARDAGINPGSGSGQSLMPGSEYVHPTAAVRRPEAGTIDIGAYEFQGDHVFADDFDIVPINPGL